VVAQRRGLAGFLADIERMAEAPDLEHLLEITVQAAARTASTDNAALALVEDRLILCARLAGGAVSLARQALDAATAPLGPIQHALSTGEALALGGAGGLGRFARDPYLVEHHVRSALVAPIERGRRRIGVVYAEDSPGQASLEGLRGLALEFAILQDGLHQTEAGSELGRRVLRHLPGAIWATDTQLRLSYIAGSLADLSSSDPSALLGQRLQRLFGGDPAILEAHAAALEGREVKLERRFSGRQYQLSIGPLAGERGRPVGSVGAAFDISQQRAIEERLVKSEQRLEEAQRLAHVGSFEWDVRSKVLTWSNELQRIYGLEPGQFEGQFGAFLARLDPRDSEETLRVVREAAESLRPFSFEHRIVRDDGSIRTLRTRGDVVKDEQGRLARMVGTCWDVTEAVATWQARERLLSLLEATIEATADGLLVIDRNAKVTIFNRQFVRMWQIPAEIAASRDDERLLACVTEQLEDAESFRRRVRDLYARPEELSFDVLLFKDGRIFERYSCPQRVGGEIVGRVWSFRDVSERERLFRRALFLADATRLLASLAVEPALKAVAQLAVPYVGEACVIDLFGDGEARRFGAVSTLLDRSSDLPSVAPAVRRGEALIYEIGSVAHLGVGLLMRQGAAGAITARAGPGCRYAKEDLELVSELGRRAALAIDNARLYRRAEDALAAREEFLAVAAHEIRGPIHAIQLSIQALREGKAPPEATPRLLQILERQGRRLTQCAEQLLDVGRINAGQLELEYQGVALGELVRDVAARLGPELARSGSKFNISTGAGRICGEWDRFRLEQVLTNLLSNAIKFGRGQPIDIAIACAKERATISVQDHGIGIEPEAKARIFKPFERGVSARHYGGFGLGLHIVRTIVEAMGGTVTVDSEPGVGSRFVVDLPLHRAGQEQEQGVSDAHPGR
jgi:PAS domain S-box-containing protein